ncbi:MAG: hypothetical protein ACRECY_10350, partial [Phyllobacterium sp.]
MAKIAVKSSGPSKQASASKTEADIDRSAAARTGENVAFALAAGSIGLAVTLIEQDRAEAAAQITHENSGEHMGVDIQAKSASVSSSDHTAQASTAAEDDGQQVPAAHSGPAGEDSSVNAAVSLKPVVEPARSEATGPHHDGAGRADGHVALSSASSSHEINAPHASGEPITPSQNNASSAAHPAPPAHQASPADTSAHDLPSAVGEAPLPAGSGSHELPVGGEAADTGSAAGGLLAPVGDLVSGVGDIVGDLLGGNGKGVLSGIGSTVDNVLDGVGNLVSGVGNIVGGLLGGDGKGVLPGVGTTVDNVLDGVGHTVSGVGEIVGDLLGGDGKGVLPGVGGTVGTVLDTVGDTVSGVGDIVGGLLGGDGKGDLPGVGSTVDTVLDTVGDTVSGVVDAVSDVGGTIGELLGGASSDSANIFDAATEVLQFSDGLFGILTPTLSFLGQSIFVPNDVVD